MNVYHYCARYASTYYDGLVYTENEILNDEDYHGLTTVIKEKHNIPIVTILSLSYMGWHNLKK